MKISARRVYCGVLPHLQVPHLAQQTAPGGGEKRGAKEKGLGHEVPTDWFLQDIKP
jgi:hypothetical protein